MSSMSGASRARTHVGSHTEHTTVNADDIALELDNSQSSVIYVDIPGMDDQQAEALLTGEPALHVEHDAVRNLWAVRKATDEEAAEAKAAAQPPASSSDTSTSSSA